MPIIKFFGHFHPLLVHLPIGIFVLALLYYMLSENKEQDQQKYLLKLILLVTALTATLSSITGLILSNYVSYGSQLLTRHQWLAFGFTFTSWLTYIVLRFKGTQLKWLLTTLLFTSFLLIILTGHAGGSLTHGTDFLSPPPVSQWFDSEAASSFSLNENSLVYEAVDEILSKKCYSCHGPNRQKGKLRLDSPEFIQAGGENGPILPGVDDPGNGLLERIHLPLNDDDHMPPEEKTQLDDSEIQLLTWWLQHGHSFDLKISDAGWSESLKAEFGLYGVENLDKQSNTLIPGQAVEPADKDVLDSLYHLKAVLVPYAQHSNYLSATLYNVSSDDLLRVTSLLSNLSPQLLSIKISHKMLNNKHITLIAKIKSLKSLYVAHCALTDQDMKSLSALQNLEILNIVGNKITAPGLLSLAGLKNLRTIYLWKTGISDSDIKELQKEFEGVYFETGSYIVPTFASDTTKLSAS